MDIINFRLAPHFENKKINGWFYQFYHFVIVSKSLCVFVLYPFGCLSWLCAYIFKKIKIE